MAPSCRESLLVRQRVNLHKTGSGLLSRHVESRYGRYWPHRAVTRDVRTPHPWEYLWVLSHLQEPAAHRQRRSGRRNRHLRCVVDLSGHTRVEAPRARLPLVPIRPGRVAPGANGISIRVLQPLLQRLQRGTDARSPLPGPIDLVEPATSCAKRREKRSTLFKSQTTTSTVSTHGRLRIQCCAGDDGDDDEARVS